MVKGLISLVTGGASGLGKATVQRLAKDGAKVILCDLKTSKGQEVADSFEGNAVTFVPTDVTKSEDVKKAVSLCKDMYNKIDVVVNAASISMAFKTYNFNKNRPHELEDFVKVMMVNTAGTFNVIRLALSVMGYNEPNKDGQRGVIINTSSFAAHEATAGQIAFAASKAAVSGMTFALARDLSNRGIRCCSIATGLFDTPLIGDLPERVVQFLSKSTLCPQRLGHPDEFAELVVSIINNPFLNATEIRLDGGFRIL